MKSTFAGADNNANAGDNGCCFAQLLDELLYSGDFKFSMIRRSYFILRGQSGRHSVENARDGCFSFICDDQNKHFRF